jgi:hypothetical protein
VQRAWATLLYVWSRWVSLPTLYLTDWVFRVERAIADRARKEVPGRPSTGYRN